MKTNSSLLLGLTIAAALVSSSTLLAQGGMGGCNTPCWNNTGMMGSGSCGMGAGPGRMRGGGPMGVDPVLVEQQLAQQKLALAITGAQEAAWNQYADAIKGKTALRTAHRQAMLSAAPTLEERLAFRQQGLEQQLQALRATRTLYQALTPEQQTKAGVLLTRSGGRQGNW